MFGFVVAYIVLYVLSPRMRAFAMFVFYFGVVLPTGLILWRIGALKMFAEMFWMIGSSVMQLIWMFLTFAFTGTARY